MAQPRKDWIHHLSSSWLEGQACPGLRRLKGQLCTQFLNLSFLVSVSPLVISWAELGSDADGSTCLWISKTKASPYGCSNQ